ncbi:MAG: hypothetical protein V3R54_07205 [Thermodesulfovibrionia bacterium]
MPLIAVMSSSTEIARILIEEGCGFVVKPGYTEVLVNALLRLYNNRQELELMGKNARQAIDTKYNLNKVARAYYIVTLILTIRHSREACPSRQ